MTDIMDSLSAVAAALAGCHAAHPDSPEIQELHDEAWKALHDQQELLGISDDDLQTLAQIASSSSARDGEPKKPPQ